MRRPSRRGAVARSDSGTIAAKWARPMPRVTIFCALGASFAFSLVPLRANGDEPDVRLSWTAPNPCPSEAAVRQRVLELTTTLESIDAQADVTKDVTGFHLVLRVKAGQSEGERRLDAPSCAVIAESVAVIVAMGAAAAVPAATATSADAGDATHPPTDPAASEVAPTMSENVPAPAPAPAPAPSGGRAERHASAALSVAGSRLRAFPYAAFDIGTMPSAALGGGVGVEVGVAAHVSLAVLGAAWMHETGRLAQDSTQGAELKLFTGQISAAYALSSAKFELAPHVLLELADMRGNGFGANHTNTSASAQWLSLGVGATVRWHANRWISVVLAADGVAPSSRHAFVITEGGTVHQPSVVAARAYLGPEVRF